MFGLESNIKKKPEEFVFDLEKDFKDPQKFKEYRERVESRVQKIKEILRTGGEDKEEYARYSLLLLGYTALTKVMSRFTAKKK